MTPSGVEIRRVHADDAETVLSADVFDGPARPGWTADFLARSGHHLLLARVGTRVVGFVSGIEIAHPDKAPEMLLYELGVLVTDRRKGIGTALVAALRDHAMELGCRGMWVPTDRQSPGAIATYRAAGAAEPDDGVILSWTFGNPS
ncbi:MAG: GNAT family N-acetyltransferase [Acidimicrobiia bacterium]|nr:GNAT family N-acetyltransferase [Acidimicrobiia bacterium]